MSCHRLVSGLPKSAEEEDEDVSRERERVQRGSAQNDLLRICDLTKVPFSLVPLLFYIFIHSYLKQVITELCQ